MLKMISIPLPHRQKIIDGWLFINQYHQIFKNNLISFYIKYTLSKY